MDTQTPRRPTRVLSRARRIAAGIALSGVVASVAALPAAPAGASSPLPEVALPNVPAVTPTAGVSRLSPSEVEGLLSTIPLKDVNAAQLADVLSQEQGVGGVPSAQLQEALVKEIELLAGRGDTLGALTNPTTDPSAMLGGLLSSSSNPGALVQQLLAGIDPQRLEALLGSPLTGELFGKTTAGGLASSLDTTTHSLAESVDTSASQLPASVMALTAPLVNGRDLAVLVPSLTGVTGGSGGPGGPGGNSGSGTAGPPGSPGVIMATVPGSSAATSTAGAKQVAGSIKIISKKIRGNWATVVVQVPGAGRVSLAGSAIKPVSATASTAERLTLRTTLSKAHVTALRKHRHRSVNVKLKASFKPVGGSSSSATTTLRFG